MPETTAEPVETETPLSVIEEKQPVTETPLSEAEDLLAKISNAEKDCRSAESEVESIKEDLKFAKASYEEKVAKLRRLAAGNTDCPLFDSAETEVQVEEEPDLGWREVPIEKLWEEEPIKGFGDSKREALIDQIGTLGSFEDLRSTVGDDADHLSKLMPRGVGKALADEIEERHLNFVTAWSNRKFNLLEYMRQIEDAEVDAADRDDEHFRAGSSAFHDGDDLEKCQEGLDCEDMDNVKCWCCGYLAAKKEAAVDAATEETLQTRAAKITPEDLEKADRENEDFEQGWQDYLNGHTLEELQEDFEEWNEEQDQNWLIGYMSAKAEHDSEALEEL